MDRILAKQKPGLKIIHLNAQSLAKKIEEFRFLFINSNIDVICVSDVSNMAIMGERFNLFRSDLSGRGGGVAIYISKKLNAKKVCVLSIFNRRENTSIVLLFIPYLFLILHC